MTEPKNEDVVLISTDDMTRVLAATRVADDAGAQMVDAFEVLLRQLTPYLRQRGEAKAALAAVIEETAKKYPKVRTSDGTWMLRVDKGGFVRVIDGD